MDLDNILANNHILPIDLIFYAFAVFEGYRFSFRKIDSNRFS